MDYWEKTMFLKKIPLIGLLKIGRKKIKKEREGE
jgi:hypothetical protein